MVSLIYFLFLVTVFQINKRNLWLNWLEEVKVFVGVALWFPLCRTRKPSRLKISLRHIPDASSERSSIIHSLQLKTDETITWLVRCLQMHNLHWGHVHFSHGDGWKLSSGVLLMKRRSENFSLMKSTYLFESFVSSCSDWRSVKLPTVVYVL